MRNLKFLLFLGAVVTLFSLPIYAQKRSNQYATTEDGKRVILNADGTWHYAEENQESIVRVNGILYRLLGCEKFIDFKDKKIRCTFELTNLNRSDVKMFLSLLDYRDDFGNAVNGNNIIIANKNNSVVLIPNLPTTAIAVVNLSNQNAKTIMRLTLFRALSSIADDKIVFRNVPIQ